MLWNPHAVADRMAIMEYIAQDNPVAAFELDELIEAKAERLDSSPKLGKAGRVKGTRELVAHPSYVIVYQVNESAGTVTVLRVLHTAQSWPATE